MLMFINSTNAGHTWSPPVESGVARIQVKGGSVSSVRGFNRGLFINLISVEDRTVRPSLIGSLDKSFFVHCPVCLLCFWFHLDNTVQFLGHYRQCIRETTINGKTVTIEQAKKAIKDEQEALPEDQAFR